MGKEISRIRLNRLYSESNIFEEISFHDGVNIILGCLLYTSPSPRDA